MGKKCQECEGGQVPKGTRPDWGEGTERERGRATAEGPDKGGHERGVVV